METIAGADLQPLAEGTEEQFIAEHYWGYTATPKGTRQYQVRHPAWQWRSIDTIRFNVNLAELYGPTWRDVQDVEPSSQFVAEGSDVEVDPWGSLA